MDNENKEGKESPIGRNNPERIEREFRESSRLGRGRDRYRLRLIAKPE